MPEPAGEHVDRKNVPLRAGDRVSQPVYPRGTVRGRITTSARAFCGGSCWVVDADGTTWDLTRKALKLKRQGRTRPASQMKERQ